MTDPKARQQVIDTSRYHVLAPVPPFIDICLQSTVIKPHEFLKIVDHAAHFQNDPRLVEMVRMGGDASAKVPYLMQAGETADSILVTLRDIAAPFAEKIENLPAFVRQ